MTHRDRAGDPPGRRDAGETMSNYQYRTFLPVILACSFPVLAFAIPGNSDRKSFVIKRTAVPPVIDGHIDYLEWEGATTVDDFHQTVPVDGGAPTESTTVHISYDDEFIYIAARLEDADPASIHASQMIQDKMFFSDDRFWVMLDSFNSKRNDYFFQVNPNGIRRDALRENNSRFIDEWSTIWLAESNINETGWETEIAIPSTPGQSVLAPAISRMVSTVKSALAAP